MEGAVKVEPQRVAVAVAVAGRVVVSGSRQRGSREARPLANNWLMGCAETELQQAGG